jgi:hypothetical protein
MIASYAPRGSVESADFARRSVRPRVRRAPPQLRAPRGILIDLQANARTNCAYAPGGGEARQRSGGTLSNHAQAIITQHA